VIDKCIFPEEEEKQPHAVNMSWQTWKTHVETECEGEALKCDKCQINIFRMYSKPQAI